MARMSLENKIQQRIFADPQGEKFECMAGSPQLKQYLNTGTLSKGFAVLSDYSVYCKGKCYVRKNGMAPEKRTVEYRIDIPEISDVRRVHRTPSWLLGVCLFFLFLAPTLLVLELITKLGQQTVFSPVLDAVVCLCLAGFFALVYALYKKNLVQISYSNGSISLDSTDLPEPEVKTFIHRLRELLAAWDEYVEQQAYAQAFAQGYNQGSSQSYSQGYNQGSSEGYGYGFSQGQDLFRAGSDRFSQ